MIYSFEIGYQQLNRNHIYLYLQTYESPCNKPSSVLVWLNFQLPSSNNNPQMQPQSTAQNSLPWRIWHGLNYQNGGICFIVGSVLFFPFFNAGTASAWFYTIGSLTFLLADITEWLHYTKTHCPFPALTANFLVSVTGSAFYLVGSMEFLPFIDNAYMGYVYFIVGSSFIVISQTWKEWRVLTQPGKTARQGYEEDVSGFYVDLYAGLGGLMYLVGSIPLLKSDEEPDFIVPAVIVYCVGGLFFTLSGIYMQKRYFCENKQAHKESYLTSTSAR